MCGVKSKTPWLDGHIRNSTVRNWMDPAYSLFNTFMIFIYMDFICNRSSARIIVVIIAVFKRNIVHKTWTLHFADRRVYNYIMLYNIQNISSISLVSIQRDNWVPRRTERITLWQWFTKIIMIKIILILC